MNTWFTSDPHYAHKNVIRLCNRPFGSLHDMHKAMTKNWEKKVQDKDLVYVMGDFAFCNSKELEKYVKGLPGRKILIQGNHDKIGEIGYLNAGFELVLQRAQIKIAGKYVNMSHYPYLNSAAEQADAEANGYKIKYADRRLLNDGNWLIHGHVHNAWKQKGRMINVGVDVWDFTPVNMSEIESIMYHLDVKGEEVYSQESPVTNYQEDL